MAELARFDGTTATHADLMGAYDRDGGLIVEIELPLIVPA